MKPLLKDQVAIVTGAGRGIGAATAKLFAREGAKVVVADLDAAPADAVAADIRGNGGNAVAVHGSVTEPDFPERLVNNAIETYGGLHILVNNAGFTWDGVIHKTTDEQWQAIIDCHLTAPFRIIRAAAPYMRDAAKNEMMTGAPTPRCIVNVSSTSGLHGNAGQINYAAAKMGVVGMTKTVAKEWGQFNIRCNAVAFGLIETRLVQPKERGETIEVHGKTVQLGIPDTLREMAKMLIPLGRSGEPDEAAGAILLLASPYASYITGHCLEVTGGAGI